MKLRELVHFRMNEMGIRPKRSLGQNFLISDYVLAEINKSVEKIAPPFVVEVGPGLGVLTESIIESGRPHLLIEMDSQFCQFWKSRGENIVEIDALKFDWSAASFEKGTLLLSNLPYQIGARLVIDVSNNCYPVEWMVLMFQKEVAERLAAPPRTKDYGMLTVVLQTHWQIQKVVDAPRGDFYPAPNVDSRVLMFKRKKGSEKWGPEFTDFVKRAFQFRRKFMVKSFANEKSVIEECLTELGFKLTVRAEEIDVENFKKLYQMYKSNRFSKPIKKG